MSFAQNGINYKAVIKDNLGNVVANQSIDVQFIIYEGAALTNNVYQESHTLNSDSNGIIITNIGEGTTSDVFNDINWGSDEHWLNVQVDTGSGLVDLGTTEFMAVPYALSSGDNYWSKNGNEIYTTNTSVGINRVNPEHTLDVRSGSITEPAGLNLSNSDKSRNLRLFSGSDTFPDPSMTWVPGNSLLFATYDDNTSAFEELMHISPSGNVGVGVDDPQARLDIRGGDWNLDAGNPGDLRIGNATSNFRIGVATGGGGAGITRMYSQGNSLHLGTNNRPSLTIGQNENVGIGTINPEARLEVHSAGLSDELIKLDNTVFSGTSDVGIDFTDQNTIPTTGARFNVDGLAIYAVSSSSYEAVDVLSTPFSGTTTGIRSSVNSNEGTGIIGIGPKRGVYGFASAANASGIGIQGRATGDTSRGVEGVSIGSSGTGVWAEGATAVYATSDSNSGRAIQAYSLSSTGDTRGVNVSVNSPDGIGVYAVGPKRAVYGFSSAANADGIGLYGRATGGNSKGVLAESIGLTGKGIHAKVTSTNSSANAILAESGGGSSYAGYFLGRVHVAGVLSKSSGSFKIDHPLDPENKYLSHSFVESPDMMNIYNGNVTTDSDGKVIVELPNYFEALNIDFRYQLTVIGQFAQAIVSKKINNNSFEIQTNKPNVEVSWQVTGVRNDAFAKKNRIKVEEEKEAENIGTYLNPEAFGQKVSNVIRNN
jgi:hypothetical protein